MNNRDFIPRKDRDLLTWVINFLTQLNGMVSRIGFPVSEFQQLGSFRDDFSAKLTLAEAPATRTSVTIKNRNDSRKKLVKTIRQDVKEYINYNRLVTDGDREALGLPVYKTTRTPSQVASEPPDYEIETSVLRRLIIHFFQIGHRHAKAKPPGQQGAEIRHTILDHLPKSIDELIHSSFDTRTPFILDFDESDRGKTVYFCLRWENTRGEKGPWSEMVAAFIP